MIAFVPRGQDPARGLSLADALLVYGEPAEPRRHHATRLALKHGRPVAPEAAIAHCVEAVDAEARLIRKLIAGSLSATCIDPRDPPNCGRIDIAAARWRTLKPDFLTSTASENGAAAAIDILLVRGVPTDAALIEPQPREASDEDIAALARELYPVTMPGIAVAEQKIRHELRRRHFRTVGPQRLRRILAQPELSKLRRKQGRPARA